MTMLWKLELLYVLGKLKVTFTQDATIFKGTLYNNSYSSVITTFLITKHLRQRRRSLNETGCAKIIVGLLKQHMYECAWTRPHVCSWECMCSGTRVHMLERIHAARVWSNCQHKKRHHNRCSCSAVCHDECPQACVKQLLAIISATSRGLTLQCVPAVRAEAIKYLACRTHDVPAAFQLGLKGRHRTAARSLPFVEEKASPLSNQLQQTTSPSAWLPPLLMWPAMQLRQN